MLEKSIAAMISAIEIYNKPDFKYREETFSILCINSWEIFLKSKLLNLASNKLAILYSMEYRTLVGGSKSKLKFPKKNRSGNAMSINLFEALRILTDDYGVKINSAVKDNLLALTEIRDNSIHFINDDLNLSLKVQEIGTAALQNYLHLVRAWFGDVLEGYNFYLMPLSFFRDFNSASGISLNNQEKKLLQYIKETEAKYEQDEDVKDYNLTLKIDVRFHKSKNTEALPVKISKETNATSIQLSEQDISEKYPWDYDVLTTRLKRRYSDFRANQDYHNMRKPLELNDKFTYIRYLNPNNPSGSKKKFYNPNIQKEFDKHYTKIS
jgi:hypothetical protein